MKKIYLSTKQTTQLCEQFSITRSAASKMLNFQSNSQLALKVRQYALNELNGHLCVG